MTDYSCNNNTKIVIGIIITFIICLNFASLSYAKQWHYSEWITDITIHSDSTFTVREIQRVEDFESASFLKRNIALEGLNKITNVAIYNENGIPLNDDETDIQHNADKVRIKITPKEKKKKDAWIIEYIVHGGIKFQDDYNELQWDVFPSDKQAFVDKVTVFINLPQEIPNEKITQALLIKSFGMEIESPDYSVISGGVLKYWAEDINSRDNITVTAVFPKGILKEDRWRAFGPYLWFILPIFILIAMFSKWWLTTQNPESKRRVIPHSNPPEDLSPSALSALINNKLDIKEIIATIIDLANQGYIKVVEKEEENILTSYKHSLYKTMDYEDMPELKDHERLLMNHIFAGNDVVSLQDLKNMISRNINRINRAVWNELIKLKYINGSPRNTKKRYIIIGILFIIVGLITFLSSSNAGLAISLSGVIIVIFGRKISPITNKGFEAQRFALGFKKHLLIKNKAKIIDDIEMFLEYLPYAIIFGIEKDLAMSFTHDKKSMPEWYYQSKNKTISDVMEFIDALLPAIKGY
jgi:hypothetical protein